MSPFPVLEAREQVPSSGDCDRQLSVVAEPIGELAHPRRFPAALPNNFGRPALNGTASHPIVRPTMHHFGLKTAYLGVMVDWYAKVLGMEPDYQGSNRAGATADCRCAIAWLGNDNASHRIVIFALSGVTDDAQRSLHKGFHNIAFEYPTLDDLLATFRRLKVLGIEPVRAADHGPTTSFYYEDPDGNSIELFVDNFGDGRLSSEFMRTSASFASNPMGADVDPEQVVAARTSGMSVAEIHESAYRGEFSSAAGFYRHFLESGANSDAAG